MNKITIKDIADRAQVSKSTVSRVLNNSGPVNIKTREKVNEVIKSFEYAPSAIARNLSRQQSSTIGVLIPEIENPFFGEILKQISDEISKKNLTMICFNSGNEPEKDEEALRIMKEYSVKGLIYTAADDYRPHDRQKNKIRLLEKINAPIVLLDRRIPELENVDGVYFDNYRAAYESVKALACAGHRKIGIINADLRRVLARERQSGFEDALRDLKLELRNDYIFLGDYTIERAYGLSKKCLNMSDPPTAILSCNNFTSLGFLRASMEYGNADGSRIACIGFDRLDINLIGFDFNYIERNVAEMGKKSIEFLLNRFNPESVKERQEYIIKPQLVLFNM